MPIFTFINPISRTTVLFLTGWLCLFCVDVLGDTHSAVVSSSVNQHDQASFNDHEAHNNYSCPMHPAKTSHEPGRCSICGMFLVEYSNSDKTSLEHSQPMMQMSDDHTPIDHQPLYVCPMHPNESSHEPGKCAICGMFLVENNVTSNNPATNKQHEAQSHIKAMQHTTNMPHEMGMTAKDKPKRYWENKQTTDMMVGHESNKVTSDQNLFSRAKRMSATDAATAKPQPTDVDHTGHSHDHGGSTYVCPMHPQIVSEDHDANCPICGMDLVEKLIPTVAAEPTTRQDETYICPMHPQILTHDADSTCPICGMDLVPKAAAIESRDNEQPQIFLESAVIQNMGIRTVKVERGNLGKSIKTQGKVTPDDERSHDIHPRTGGWIERVYPITEGDRIERKEELVDFYSPWINQAQLDFITALEEFDLASFEPTRRAELDAKIDSHRNTLRSLNVPPMDLMRIEKSRKVLNTVQITAPAGGWITDLNVSKGTYVEPYQSMFTIVDLSQVWVMVDIFEHQAPWIRRGQEVSISTPAIPGREWSGEVEFIYPEVNAVTRTLRARIEVSNPDEALLLNMFVQVDLSEGAAKKGVVTVPREAIILTGEREIIVKFMGKGHFQPVEVDTGLWGNNQVEILEGINEGDEVVVSGQFLIDSESNIQSSLLRMSE